MPAPLIAASPMLSTHCNGRWTAGQQQAAGSRGGRSAAVHERGLSADAIVCCSLAPSTFTNVNTRTIATHQLHHQGAVALGAEQAARGGILLAVVIWIGAAVGAIATSIPSISRPLAAIRTPGVCGVEGLLQLPAG